MTANTLATDLATTVHRLLWRELKPRILAVRSVLYCSGLLYKPLGPDLHVPDELKWARIWGYTTSRLSVDGDRWFITKQDKPLELRMEIPAKFVNATPAECRRIARRIIAEDKETENHAAIKHLQRQIEQLQAA